MKCCLIVDASGVIRKIARRILETAGWWVVEAENGEVALHCCQARMPDAILVDWLSPSSGVAELLATLRRWPGGTQARIIYCTTEYDPIEISRMLAGGADDFLLKPFDRQSLLEKLEPVAVAV